MCVVMGGGGGGRGGGGWGGGGGGGGGGVWGSDFCECECEWMHLLRGCVPMCPHVCPCPMCPCLMSVSESECADTKIERETRFWDEVEGMIRVNPMFHTLYPHTLPGRV